MLFCCDISHTRDCHLCNSKLLVKVLVVSAHFLDVGLSVRDQLMLHYRAHQHPNYNLFPP